METTRVEKRILSEDVDPKILEPILVRIGEDDITARNIHIDKDKFTIGRARDNDEIILDPMISRKHCLLKSEGHDEWTVTDLSSTAIFLNHIRLQSGSTSRIKPGDILQLSTCEKYQYIFILDTKPYSAKRLRLDNEMLDSVFAQQDSFAINQETQKKHLQDQLQNKQKEQVELKLQLQCLLKHQKDSMESTDDLKKQIGWLKSKIEMGSIQEQRLQNLYSDLLKKLDEERLQFEAKLAEEKQKWEEALNLTKQEKEELQEKMKKEIQCCREELQAKWQSEMETRVKEEKDIQAQLLNEKTLLEQKLKETEQALRDQETKTEQVAKDGAGSAVPLSTCMIVEVMEEKPSQDICVLDAIDLTKSPTPSPKPETTEVLEKFSDIMDEQLTCSICAELFIRATTLNCTHTFCQFCIKSWIKKRRECPICRACISSKNRSLVLDNFIEKMLENLPSHLREKRQEIIEERKKAHVKRRRKTSSIL